MDKMLGRVQAFGAATNLVLCLLLMWQLGPYGARLAGHAVA